MFGPVINQTFKTGIASYVVAEGYKLGVQDPEVLVAIDRKTKA